MGTMVDDFLSLSKILTGREDLNSSLCQQYLDRLNVALEAEVSQVLAKYRALAETNTAPIEIGRTILAETALRPVVSQIILLWFTSATQDPPATPPAGVVLRYGSQEAYFSGIGWRVIGAHVPGLSGGYFGHWRYRPDNEPGTSP